MTDASVTPFVNYRERYVALANALGIECDAATVGAIDHERVLAQAEALRRISEEVPETCSDMLQSVVETAKVSGYKSTLRDMIANASRKAEEMAEADRSSPLTHLFGKPGAMPAGGYIPGLDKVFEVMAAADAARVSKAEGNSLAERLLELELAGHGDAVLALVEAARKLPAGEWWLDENRPWRLMLNLNAVAEDEDLYLDNESAAVMALFDTDGGERGTVGDGQPAHLRAILRLLEAASSLHRPNDGKKAPVVELVTRDKK